MGPKGFHSQKDGSEMFVKVLTWAVGTASFLRLKMDLADVDGASIIESLEHCHHRIPHYLPCRQSRNYCTKKKRHVQRRSRSVRNVISVITFYETTVYQRQARCTRFFSRRHCFQRRTSGDRRDKNICLSFR